MKKVVFLIGMMVGFASTVFGQYDVVTVSSEDDFTQVDTWYQVKGNDNEYFFYGEENDQEMVKYVKQYIALMGGDIDNPSRVQEIDGILYSSYDDLTGDGTNSTVVLSKYDGLILIYKIEL